MLGRTSWISASNPLALLTTNCQIHQETRLLPLSLNIIAEGLVERMTRPQRDAVRHIGMECLGGYSFSSLTMADSVSDRHVNQILSTCACFQNGCLEDATIGLSGLEEMTVICTLIQPTPFATRTRRVKGVPATMNGKITIKYVLKHQKIPGS